MIRGRLRLGLLMSLLICQPSLGQAQQTVLRFFYFVNQTGREVTVRGFADGQELFVQRLDAHVVSSPGVKGVPLSPSYPAVERKIPVPQGAKRLEIEVLALGGKTLDIPEFPKGPGFRVIIRDDGIVVTQDYYPIRSSASGPARPAPR